MQERHHVLHLGVCHELRLEAAIRNCLILHKMIGLVELVVTQSKGQ